MTSSTLKERVQATLKSEDTEGTFELYVTRTPGYLWALLFKKLHIHPIAVTLLSIVIGALAGYFFWWDDLYMNLIGMFLLIWANWYDCADGQLARMTGQKTLIGRILDGFAGGHSGVEIHKQHTNAIRLLASLLSHASGAADFRLVSLSGGGKENAIPKEAKAVVSVRSFDATTFEQSIKESEAVWMQEIRVTEPHAKIELEKTDIAADKVLDSKSTANVIYALWLSPDGVYRMSQEIKGMVQTSLNLGTAYIDADKLVYKYLIRSNTVAGKKLLLERVTTFVKHLSGKVVTMSDYPAWEYKSDSQLRKICVDSFTNVYGHEPEVTSIHAGLECGILAGKMPGVDMISFGPTLESVHTPDECMDAASVERTWEYLMEILKSL